MSMGVTGNPQTGNPYIVTPPDVTRIIRYVDVYKFIDLVVTRSLYFCRLDRLVVDPMEGRLPQRVIDKDDFVANQAATMAEVVRECVCVNCWHCRDTENLQMWDEYAAGGTGLAIRSTIGMLKTALSPAAGEQFIGEVRYVDHLNDDCDMNGRDLTAAICLKDHSFRHENEVRVIMVTAARWSPGR